VTYPAPLDKDVVQPICGNDPEGKKLNACSDMFHHMKTVQFSLPSKRVEVVLELGVRCRQRYFRWTLESYSRSRGNCGTQKVAALAQFRPVRVDDSSYSGIDSPPGNAALFANYTTPLVNEVPLLGSHAHSSMVTRALFHSPMDPIHQLRSN
jgi:hypothetical protein